MMAGWRRGTAVLALGLVLGLGLGAWGMRVYFQNTLLRWDPAERLVLKLGNDLELSAEQRERLALIIAEQKGRMELRRQAWRLEVRTLARDGEQQLAAILSPAQAERFARIQDGFHGQLDRYLWSSDSGPSAVAIGGKH